MSSEIQTLSFKISDSLETVPNHIMNDVFENKQYFFETVPFPHLGGADEIPSKQT